jgi:hypothetical protein
MKFLDKLFGRSEPPIEEPADEDEPVVIVPIPPLVTVLLHLEKTKGSPLTEADVMDARDKAICMTMRASHRDQLAEKRGYDDIRLENAWEDWQAFVAEDPSILS